MKNNLLRRVWAFAMLLSMSVSAAMAAEVTYRIVEYNKTTGEFVLSASGSVPKGAWAYWENEYGATTGNRYNQIPRNKKATLYLEGWKGCTLKGITLSMCSNAKSGQVGLTIADDDDQLYTERPSDFASEAWFGQWVSKDLGVYVDIHKTTDIPALTSDEASITLAGGTAEGSVYLDAITIEYDEEPNTELESPLGWNYEKLTAKSTLSDGDEVMIYRNGCAAADIDGMQTSHYLDVVALPSTTDVTEHEVLCFTLKKDEAQGLWTLTDQYGRILGANGKQSLAWNEGNTLWNISLGYDGATIANANAAYGTLRYNAPTESYARFALYTSKSLPLPYLYLKKQQNEPVVSRSLTFDEAEMTVALEAGNVALRPTLLPASTTDKRLRWTSSDTSVATVNGGYVTLLGIGKTTITASSCDGGAEASVLLNVTEASSINSVKHQNQQQGVRKVKEGTKIVIMDTLHHQKYTIGGDVCN